MYTPYLEVVYDPVTNTGKSIYRCGETEEVIHYEGQRGDLVKFTPETWPTYLQTLYGRSLPLEIPGYGYVKYVEDAVAVGIPEAVYAQYPLRRKSDPERGKISYIRYERRDYEGNLLESKVLFDEQDAVWFSFDAGTLDVPEGADPAEYGLQLAEQLHQGG